MPPPGSDIISDLPESLITHILFHLPTKESEKTSVLSRKWKNLWLKVPGLDLDSRDFPFSENEQLFASFVDRFFSRNPNSRLEKFKVNYSRFKIKRSTDLIESAISRGIRSLELESNTFYRDCYGQIYPCVDSMPMNLYESKTLVSLKLSFSGLVVGKGLVGSFVVSMPCLRTMHLNQIRWNRMYLEKLLLGCPVLEELTYVRNLGNDFEDFTRVRSRSLKRLNVPFVYGYLCGRMLGHHIYEVDAPGLEYLSLQEDHFDRIVLVKKLTCLSTIDLNIKFAGKNDESFDLEDLEKRNEIRDFLNGIVSVRHMIISKQTVKALERYSRVGLIPKFESLSRLEAEFPSSLLEYLPAFLESFPNLKQVVLKIVYLKDEETKDELVGVPGCFDTTLKCVEVKGLYVWEEDHGKKIANYFLENSAVLKKLTLSFRKYLRYPSNSEIREELSKIVKRSRSCQVIVCDE